MQVAHGPWDTSKWRCRNYNYGTRAAEKLTRYCTRIVTIPTEGPRGPSRRSAASKPLLAGRTSVSRWSSSTHAILRIATSTHCGWVLFTQQSVDRRSTFYTWGCVKVTKQSSQGTGQSLNYPRTWVPSPLRSRQLDWNHRGHCRRHLSVTGQPDWSTILSFSGNCSTGAA
jgi:hypothetical protein